MDHTTTDERRRRCHRIERRQPTRVAHSPAQDRGRKGYYSQQFVRLINQQNTRQANLSSREMEVLEYITDGHSTNAIAQELNISTNTVEFHRHNLMHKLQVGNVAQMVKKRCRWGWNSLSIDHSKR